MKGSSPLARGGPQGLPASPQPAGLIPAGAGGLHEWVLYLVKIGLIPAGAGRTSDRPQVKRAARAHSPLARGGRASPQRDPTTRGLIPAGAGRTATSAYSWAWFRAHPRWRGADMSDLSQPAGVVGSSPLARGGRCLRRQPGLQFGLIPAGAGRTATARTGGSLHGAHPRWRGADVSTALPVIKRVGSSPLARGGPRLRPVCRMVSGLIPAGAGRTGHFAPAASAARAHPRWRGADAPTNVWG